MLKIAWRQSSIMGPEHQKLTHAHSIALRACDLSQVGTQFAKKHILGLEPLHLPSKANSIASVTELTRPTLHMFKSQAEFAIKRCSGQVDDVRNVSLKSWRVPMRWDVAEPVDVGGLVVGVGMRVWGSWESYHRPIAS